MTHKPLGRGLGALLAVEKPDVSESLEVEIGLIEPGSMQPRTRFDEAKLAELAASIQSNGIVQPLLVRSKGNRFELIAGERRWRAAKLAGLRTVPVVVREVPDAQLLEIALVENIQRENLNPIEEAHALKGLVESVGMTQESLAQRIGRDRTYVTNYLRLLRLPADVQHLVEEGKISTGHARALLGLGEVDLQRRFARKIVEHSWSVRQTEQSIRRESEATGKSKVKATGVVPMDPNMRALESKFRRRLGTQVRIVQSSKSDQGSIQIQYYSISDLNRLADALLVHDTATPDV